MNVSLKLPRRLRLGGIIEAGLQLVTSSGLKILCSFSCLFALVSACLAVYVFVLLPLLI